MHLLRLLAEAGHDVHVVPTDSALEFVGRPTWEGLAGHRVSTDVWTNAAEVEHVHLGRSVELAVIAPATADLLSRLAHGRADDLLTATMLTVTCPVLVAPAMHTEMWLHPATQANVALLRERGVHVLDPDSGRLAGADSGPGRLPEPGAIATAALALVGHGVDDGAGTAADLAGVRAVVSAGGTREPLDPVRFLGNRSSGRQGLAVADALAARGADVTLVAAHVEIPLDGVAHQVVRVGTALELARVMTERSADADVVVMAAAVADYRPASAGTAKLKKTGDDLTLTLVENPDVLAGLVATRRPGQTIVGFAAETGDAHQDAAAHGRDKAIRKGADLLAVNVVGEHEGFGDVPNAVVVLDASGAEVGRAQGSKADVAHGLVDLIVGRLHS
ncbi:phosphopantothenoylcysteine decarboxylase [Litorihabitans aurantiacus]|uniref:Coenzyme A biosynthesis bifunctional protein CoaBC n=1 Tax=Litorihabitans aurantiacus TaxID=1930061 RepID=A0AA37XDJ9_9MICO|nr:phosphopantothenoylcysteine decarboxylase [Litorihabitans aurantiacus]